MLSNYFLVCYSARPLDGCQSYNEEDIICPIDKNSMDSLCPVNTVTGLRDQPLTRILDPNCSDSERNALLSTLQKQTFKSDNVDDETKLMFVKLRSLQTPSELAQFRNAIQSWIDSHPDSDITIDNTPTTTSNDSDNTSATTSNGSDGD